MHPLSSMFDVTLKQNESFKVPVPVELPADVHPLPPDITEYFVYTFALEHHVLHPHPPHESHQAQIEHLQQKRQSSKTFLEDRAAAKEQSRKEQLRRIAPGYNSDASAAGILQPDRDHLQHQRQLSAASAATPGQMDGSSASDLADIFGQQSLQ